MELKEVLSRPDVQAALKAIADAAAPETAPLAASDVADALAKIEREQTAATIRTALNALKSVPDRLSYAAWLEHMAQEASKEQSTIKTAACAMPLTAITQAQITQFEQPEEEAQPKEPDGRGGSREGAGRKKKPPLEKKAEPRLITLYPDEWAEIDRIAENLKIKRPKVIRLALQALTRELKEKEPSEAEEMTTP